MILLDVTWVRDGAQKSGHADAGRRGRCLSKHTLTQAHARQRTGIEAIGC